MIPYGRQSIAPEDIEAVVAVLRSDFLTQGPAVPAFEQGLCDYTGAPHAVALNSGTSALHVACMALDVQEGDVVWTVPNTFVASANCARYCGAEVDFVDVEADTGNLCVEVLREKLETAERAGRLPKVVIPVHFAGRPCAMPQIHALGERYGFRIIEDASHALGATLGGERIGNAPWADVTVLSFHPVKMITSAEGGAVLTRDAALAERMSALRTHGIVKGSEQLAEGGWCYAQLELGYNYRLSDVHAALGLSQLQRLDGFLERRRELARRYGELLADLPVKCPPPSEACSWHLYRIGVDAAKRKHIYEALRERGYGVQVHYIPVHLQPYYRALGFKSGDFPVAERFYAEGLSIPLFPDLTDGEQAQFIQALVGPAGPEH